MEITLYKHGFKSEWQDIKIDKYEGYYPNMTDYHMHEYYEISLILSGNVNVLLTDKAESGATAKLVLLAPQTPHYIYCEPDLLYSRRNILFAQEFLSDFVPQWKKLSKVFSRGGAVLKLTDERRNVFYDLVKQLETETDPFRQRLILMYFLSLVADDMQGGGTSLEIPPYVTEALSFIGSHYSEKIVASDLAFRLGVGRTTLITGFKKYTGTTLNEYLLRCRLKAAVELLQEGGTEQQAAEDCGFTDACNLIRSFKRQFGTTPKKYLKSIKL